MGGLEVGRRGVLGMVAMAAAGGAAAAPGGSFAAEPLPFDPKGISGLSEKLLVSHHDNNYVGAVKRLGAIEAELAAVDMASVPGYRLNGLKREELIAWNSKLLHELYFRGLGGREAPSGALAAALAKDFGGLDRWAAEFGAMGKALGGGSGWVLLTWSRRDGRLANIWAADHTMGLADGTPLLALDMYEHAYALDYGARAAAYVDAFMKAMTWTEANRRFAAAAA